jgi:hypothetical protein
MEKIMVEPVTTLTAAAIATLLATKAVEKTGEKIGEGVWALVGQFLTALKRKDQATATAIEAVAQQPELAEQQPEDYDTAVLIARVEEAAQDYPELQQAIQAVATAAKVQHPIINNFAKLQEKGILIQGGQPNFSGSTFNF